MPACMSAAASVLHMCSRRAAVGQRKRAAVDLEARAIARPITPCFPGFLPMVGDGVRVDGGFDLFFRERWAWVGNDGMAVALDSGCAEVK